jgi:spartin
MFEPKLLWDIGTDVPRSYAISQTTNLLLTTITTASNYYVSHSTPSPSHPCNSNTSRSTSTSTPPPPLPSRTLVFLTSERTRKGLAGVHAVSSQAVQVSSKTVSIIDNMIRRAMGAQPKRPRAFLGDGSLSHAPSLPPRMLPPASLSPLSPRTSSPSSSGSYLVPPPNYHPAASPSSPFQRDKPALPLRRSPSPTPPQISRIEPGATSAVIHAQHPQHPSYSGSAAEPFFPDDKPPLPPRRSPSPATVSFPPRTGTSAPTGVTPRPLHRLATKDSVLLSADLILSTLDHSARQLLNGGTESVGTAVGHKCVIVTSAPLFPHLDELCYFVSRYGPDAGHSSMLLAGTARNVGLVYVDLAGIGRRALLRRAGIQFVKGRLSSQ